MILQLVYWFFLSVIQDIFFMVLELLGVKQYLIFWRSGMIFYLYALVSVYVYVFGDCV